MSNTDGPDIAGFLRELGELCTKYDVVIEGCGCCGSPYVTRDGVETWDNVRHRQDEGSTAITFVTDPK